MGIFQGRGTPPLGRGIQFFPFEEWELEFPLYSSLGFHEMEFIFDKERYEENPLWTKIGIKKINDQIQASRVRVNHVCADFFMREPFHKMSPQRRKRNLQLLIKLLDHSHQIGATDIELPFLDDSSLKTAEEISITKEILFQALVEASKLDMNLCLEADLIPSSFADLMKDLNHPNLKITYDSGNSASLGYSTKEEIELLGKYFGNIHIKDRIFKNGTVALGAGNANFDELFSGLKRIDYGGSLILQAARGDDGLEKETIQKHLDFVQRYISSYLSE